MRERLKAAASSLPLLALFAACAGLALGCGWSGFENSVRFDYYESNDRDRSRLPPLPPDVRGATKPAEKGGAEELTSSQRAAETDALWDAAVRAEAAGELAKERKLLGDYVAQTSAACVGDDYVAPLDCQGRRNSALDRLDALASLDRGSTHARVLNYLEARAAYDAWVAGAKGDSAGTTNDSEDVQPVTPEHADARAAAAGRRAEGRGERGRETHVGRGGRVEARGRRVRPEPRG